MRVDEPGKVFRPAERRELLAHLSDLGSPRPERRAAAALKATEILRQKGMSWSALMSPLRRGDSCPEGPPSDWREHAITLLESPDLTTTESAFIRKCLSGNTLSLWNHL
jgi:hypothetical protein